MEIIKEQNEGTLKVSLNGRMDTNAAQILINELDEMLVDGVEEFILDMAECGYVASSGLRAILNAQKKMNALQGTMTIKNVVGDVMEVFEMTGFADIFNFE